MTIYKKPQKAQDIFVFQAKGSKGGRTHHIIRQDTSAPKSERSASRQPWRPNNVMRTVKADTNSHRSKKNVTTHKVPITLWIKQSSKADIAQRAVTNGGKKPLSLSAVGGALLERQLQEDHDMQYGAMLTPLMEQVIRAETKGQTWILSNMATDIAFLRCLVTNILYHLPEMEVETFRDIVKQSETASLKSLSRQSPQKSQVYDNFLNQTKEGYKTSEN
jgi:hypothetical protein